MNVKITKKIDLFETFQEKSKAPEVKVEVLQGSSDPISSIKADVDNIISGLNDLVNGLGKESTNESEAINESSPVDQVLSSDISALPMLVAGGALVGVVALVAYIKKIKKKKKIKGLYEPAHKSKIVAAQMDVKISQINLSSIEDPNKKEKVKQQIDLFKEKQQKLLDDAAEVEKTLEEAFPDNGELLSLLRAETRVEVAQIKLSGNLSDAEKKKMESMLSNAKKSIDSQVKKAEEKLVSAEEKAKNTPDADKIKRYQSQIEEINQKINNLDKDKEDYKDKLGSYNRIKQLLQNKVEELEHYNLRLALFFATLRNSCLCSSKSSLHFLRNSIELFKILLSTIGAFNTSRYSSSTKFSKSKFINLALIGFLDIAQTQSIVL
jgi:IS1 family transposase